jgi:hypothetical protein
MRGRISPRVLAERAQGLAPPIQMCFVWAAGPPMVMKMGSSNRVLWTPPEERTKVGIALDESRP